ncbi:outer dynein arm-docking complex subunit 3-like [Haliotis rufescens]|uniref:outer dynein arm-docking complex subunit 3-like n=1 Tax=Haliotis rufescens TaxID=6454 RepID=UPI001EB03F52|nr:outer dynein arm-docking complex subunit 3-like [Haliotis rufescens]
MQMRTDTATGTASGLSEQIDELRGKLHLKERDGKAYYEGSEALKTKNEELIARLRAENKYKRVALNRSIKADTSVIQSVFHNRKEELLSMHRYTAEKAIRVMDQKVCEASKRLNSQQHEVTQKENQLDELELELSRMLDMVSYDYDSEKERNYRRLQNELDKARIKFDAASNITGRYEAILAHMQEECRLYPTRLDVMEQQVTEARAELSELKQMNEKATYSSQDARTNLLCMEREMYQAKRSRDQQLNEAKKEVERRKEPVDRTEKRPRMSVISESNDVKSSRLQALKAGRHEKILTLEEAFEKIKKAINVSDIQDVVFRVANQDNTRGLLVHQKKEKLGQRHKLQEDLAKLKAVFEELKFTSQRQAAKGRLLVDGMEDYACSEEKRRVMSLDMLDKKDKLLLDLQKGIATLFDKLKEIKLKPPHHNFTKGDPVDDLANCERRLVQLMATATGKGDERVAVGSKNVDTQKLHEFLENRLPAENTRIRLDEEDNSDSDDFTFDHDQDNEGHLSRDDVKRLGREILGTKLKPKKRKARKSRKS